MTPLSFATNRAPALLSGLLACALVAGCGSTPSTSSRSGGGYYQDDGPHARPPEGLDKVPDAVPRKEALHRYANRPYKVMGKRYTPATRIKPFRQRGHASWYGKKFHGRKTASGERYDMYKMTAAHPTLPIPSYVRVTNLENERSVVVRVNDRGPFLRGRVIDLSYTAAKKLDYIRQGSARVEVEAILPGEATLAKSAGVSPLRRPGVSSRADVQAAAVVSHVRSERRALKALPSPVAPAPAAQVAGTALAAAPAPVALPAAAPSVETPAPTRASVTAAAVEDDGPRPYVQLGAFSNRANAEGFRDMAAAELDEPPARLRIVPEGLRFRLQLGPYATVEEARSAVHEVGATLSIKPFVVQR